jgi:hypothetical protein
MNKILILTAIIALYVNAAIIPFDKTAVEQVFQNKKAALFLFTNGND